MNKTIKILHLEDLPSDALFIKHALIKSKIAFQELIVDTRDKFVAALTTFSPDIILADHSLPSFNSIEALKILKQTKLDIPFIIVTAAMSDESAVELIMKGADDYIIKDRLSRLPLAILNALEKFRLKKEHQVFLDELTKNEKRYRALIEHSADGVIILDASGKPNYVSPSVKNVLGYDLIELAKMDLFTIMHPDDIPDMEMMLNKILSHPGQTMKGHTGRMLHKDGSWRWIEATVTNLLNDPAVNGIVDNFRDVTERKLAQDALIFNEHKFRSLVENSMDGMAILSAKGKPSYVSPSIINVLGYTDQEGMELDLFSLTHQEDFQEILRVMELAMTNPGVAIPGRATRMKHKNGGWRWIEGMITNMLHDKAINGFVDNFRDVTERRLSEQLVMDSEEKYRLLFETSMDGILLTLPDGQILAANQAACNIFQMTQNEIIAAGRSGLVDVNDSKVRALLDERKRFGRATGEIMMLRKDGSNFASEVSSTVFTSTNGMVKTSMIIRDISNRKQADENDRFQANLLNTIGQAVISTDLDGMINYWNKAAHQIYGWTAREARGKNISELMPSLASEQQKRQISDALLNGQTWSDEFKIRRKNGTYFSTLINDFPVYDQDEQLRGRISISTDITEKKALEQLLDKATTMARIGSYEADLVNNVMFWSPMTKLIHEVEHDFVPENATVLDFYKPGMNRRAISVAVDQAIEKHTPFDLELLIITAKGNEKWIRVIGEAEHQGDQCIRLYGSFQDIDKMKKTESEVLRAYEEKNIILESIGDAFFAVDKDWVVNYWNKEAAKLLAKPKRKVLNKNLWEVFPESNGLESHKKYIQAVKTKQIVHFEDYYPPLERWLEVSAYPSANGLSVFFKDITERKLSEKQLKELNSNLQQYTNELVLSNKGLEQFSYMVSHNLRAPVANIIGLAGLLSEDTYPEDLKRDFLNGIQDNVKRLDDVISDLNTILQVKRQISEKNETLNFDDLVDNIQSSIHSLIVKENVKILTDFSVADKMNTLKSYLHSIFYNLIMNSIKYHQHGVAPVIKIKSIISDHKLTLSFKDNGMGIDLSKNKQLLFGLYKRFHNHVEGKGMGLFMVKTQVEILGGTISANSIINEGTEFLIEFNV